ncbi:MAG: hypothetical protein ACFFE4_13035 [Candidatus Thorarchaeota archaeon]
MNSGKNLSILGGILTLISTYFLAYYQSGFAYAYGFGALIRIPQMFADAPSYGSALGIPFLLVYLIAVSLFIFLMSGIFQIMIGINRVIAIIGSIFALCGAIFLFLVHSGVLPITYEILFIWDPILQGILPFHVDIASYSLGIYILLIGSVLSLIGGILKRD